MNATRWDELARVYFQRLEGSPETGLESGLVHGTLDGISDDDFASFCRCDPVDAEALARLLDDRRAMHFVKLLVSATHSVPELLFLPMVKAGVRAPYKEDFILPCVLCHGRRRTTASLIALAKQASDSDKAGAAEALRWGTMSEADAYWPRDHLQSEPIYWPGLLEWQRSVIDKAEERVDDLQRELEAWASSEFIRNPNVDVRMSLAPYLSQTPEIGFDELRRAIDSLHDSLTTHSDRSLLLQRLPRRIRLPWLFPDLRPAEGIGGTDPSQEGNE